MKNLAPPSKKEHIRQFIEQSRKLFETIPGFIHTTPAGGGVSYSAPTFDDDELTAVIESILFGKWLSAGESVRQFEDEFSEMFGMSGSVMVNSGSSANLVMMAALKKCLGWEDEDEIILSVVGFPTTLSSVVLNRLKPIFVDIEFNSLNFDIDKVADAITDRTRAIFISPVLGNPPNFDDLKHLADSFNIDLVLDDCDSLGSKWDGHYLSDYCVASSCSFYPSHHITTGQGGMVSSDDMNIVNTVRSMACWGRACVCNGIDNLLPNGSCNNRFRKWIPEQDIILDHRYLFTNMGYNLQPLDLQGAIGLEQLKKFDMIRQRRVLHHNIIRNLVETSLPETQSVSVYPKADVSWFGVPIICPDKEYKVALVSHLEANKIQTRNYFAGNILLHSAYSHLGNWEDYPEANKVLERVFFLGCSPNYTTESLIHIGVALDDFNKIV